VREKLEVLAEGVRAEGWRWVEVAPDFPYGHTFTLRRIASTETAMSEAEQAEHDRLRTEYDALEAEHAGTGEDLSEEVDARLAELETALARIENRPHAYDPDEVARAGAFVSLDYGGTVLVDRGWVRPEDEVVVERGERPSGEDETGGADVERPTASASGASASTTEAPEEEDGIRPLPERLVTELTAHRTLVLRDALAGDPEAPYLAVLHALACKAFYRFGSSSCLEIEAKSTGFATQAPGLNDTSSAKAIVARHQAWAEQMPQAAEALWDTLVGFDHDSRQALFAYCAALTVNGVQEAWNRSPGRLAHADRLAEALGLGRRCARPRAGRPPSSSFVPWGRRVLLKQRSLIFIDRMNVDCRLGNATLAGLLIWDLKIEGAV